MIGDYFTNQFQGRLFQKFRKLILGIEDSEVTKYNTKAHKWIKEKKQKKSILANSIKAGI